jgi:Ca-activated chloride channel family protein
MSFGAPGWFSGLFLIPILVALFVRAEARSAKRLREFVSVRLLAQLAGTVNRPRRMLRFGLQLLGFSLAIISLAQPRWGYTFQDVKRKGLDLLIAVDTSRSMLSNDVQPNRLERVKLAAHDLINDLQGDRVGLIAFAGRAFLQAPLTIDYDAAMESINHLDTKTIPEGGTNISAAIGLAAQSFGKSAIGNRALVIFTDGEELSGDAVKSAKAAADVGVRIFTIGVGTPAGSLIPVTTEDGETSFVKDSAGQVVKSKLAEKRLREIAQAAGGFYLHLEDGPRTMQQLYREGPAKMQAAEMDVRLSRRPIERYGWPLGAALIALSLSILIGERKHTRERSYASAPVKIATAAATSWIALCHLGFAAAPGLDAYHDGKFEDAYTQFQQTLKAHPQSRAEDKLQFDSGTAAYKLKDYSKALESFSQALLSPERRLQSKSYYNLGNTLYQRGETQKSDDKKLSDWTNALDHYQQTLKLEPENKEAKENYDFVKNKIDELKNKKKQQPQPSPSPSPKQKDKQQEQNQQNQQSQQDQQQNQQQQPSQDRQSQSQSRSAKDQQQEKQNDQSQAKNEPQQSKQQQGSQPSPSPSPSGQKRERQQKGEDEQSSPTPGPGSPTPATTPGETGDETDSPSPTPDENGNEMPSPSPSPGNGEESEQSPTPSATPAESPQKKFAGEVKEAGQDQSEKPPDKSVQLGEVEVEAEGQMTERQAEALLQSLKDEETRVRLDERKATRRVYNDW